MEDDEKCVICTDSYVIGNVKTIRFGCGHQFHSGCLMSWIETNGHNDNTARCPQCRQVVIEWPKKRRVPFYRDRDIQGLREDIQHENTYSGVTTVCLYICVVSFILFIFLTKLDSGVNDIVQPTTGNNTLILSVVLREFLVRHYITSYGHVSHLSACFMVGLFNGVSSALYIFENIIMILPSIREMIATRSLNADRIIHVISNIIESFVDIIVTPSSVLVTLQPWNVTNPDAVMIPCLLEYFGTVVLYMAYIGTIYFIRTMAIIEETICVFCSLLVHRPSDIDRILSTETNRIAHDILTELYQCSTTTRACSLHVIMVDGLHDVTFIWMPLLSSAIIIIFIIALYIYRSNRT